MLLVMDIGNTNTLIGIFLNGTLTESWRVKTAKDITADEFNILIKSLFHDRGIDPGKITKSIFSSVVPPAVPIIDAFCEKYLNITPFWITTDAVRQMMPIRYKNPGEVGADRIVNAVAAWEKYGTSLIIVDFGTATTFDAISGKGEYLGGAISPGITISAEALFQHASKLPRVEIFNPPRNIIGRDTAESMKSGIIHGYASLVDGMVTRIKREMKCEPAVIATGGLSPLISGVSRTVEHVETNLTLDGLRIISRKLQ